MFSQMTKKNLQVSNESCHQLLRDSLDKMRGCHQKLMVFQVLTSKKTLLCELSTQANLLSKRALGVDVSGLIIHPNSNLRAFSYILIQALCKPNIGLETGAQMEGMMMKFKQNPPAIKNYLLCQKFKPLEILEIFSAMQYKISELLQSGLSLNEILKVYSGYLELTSFFLRCLLFMVKLDKAQDCNQKLCTNEVYSILSQYLDLSYIVNKNLYLFPDLKAFIAAIDDKQFIFGRYYENSEQLKNNEDEIRQSTMNYINEQNQNFKQMKLSNINLDVTMSQFMYSQRIDVIPFSSKAPTPEFGGADIVGFEDIMVNSFADQHQKKDRPTKQSNQKQTYPESNLQFDLASNGLDIQKQRQLMKQSAFVRKGYDFDDPGNLTPPSNNLDLNKNGFGSAYYLHQFDFYRNANAHQGLTMEQIRSERVLMKGSSMVDQGQFFLQQVGELKKQMQSQMLDRQRGRIISNNTLQQSVSARNLGSSFDKNSKKLSPFAQNVKSQVMYDNKSKSSNSNISRKNTKKMEISSQVYQVRIGSQANMKGSTKIKSPGQSYSRSTSQNKPSYSPKQLPSYKSKFNSPTPIQLPSTIKIVKPKKIQKVVLPKKYTGAYRQSEATQNIVYSRSGNLQSNNHNHIHIHIHNQNSKSRSKSKSQHKNSIKIQAQSPKSKQVNIQYSCNINDKKQLKNAFQNAIPQIIKHIQNQKISTNYNSKQKQIKHLNQSISEFYSNYNQNNSKNYVSQQKIQADHLKSKSDKVIYPYAKYSPVDSVKYNSMHEVVIDDQQSKLKKRKSQNGLQLLNQQRTRSQKYEGFVAPHLKMPFHIPSFLRKKQKTIVQNPTPSFSKYVQKSHNQQYQPNHFQAQGYTSTQTSIQHRQQPKVRQYTKNSLKLAYPQTKSKATAKGDNSIQSPPTFGSPEQQIKQRKKR